MKKKLLQWLIILSLMMVALPGAAVSAPPDPEGDEVESLHSSYVYRDPAIGGEKCSMPGASQTFCFSAISSTADYEYATDLWMRFPAGWTVNNIYVQGTPYCINGGSFNSFSWSVSAANEVRITHQRKHSFSDICQAYYCFQVTSGSNSPGSNLALVSWYWRGDGYNYPPHYPCSIDGYTPTGQPACDESIWAQAYVPSCSVYLPLIFRGN